MSKYRTSVRLAVAVACAWTASCSGGGGGGTGAAAGPSLANVNVANLAAPNAQKLGISWVLYDPSGQGKSAIGVVGAIKP